MNKQNLLSRAEMKKVMGGDRTQPGGCSMHCRDNDNQLIGETVSVTSCDVGNWDTHCSGKTGYVKDKSNCNCW